ATPSRGSTPDRWSTRFPALSAGLANRSESRVSRQRCEDGRPGPNLQHRTGGVVNGRLTFPLGKFLRTCTELHPKISRSGTPAAGPGKASRSGTGGRAGSRPGHCAAFLLDWELSLNYVPTVRLSSAHRSLYIRSRATQETLGYDRNHP